MTITIAVARSSSRHLLHGFAGDDKAEVYSREFRASFLLDMPNVEPLATNVTRAPTSIGIGVVSPTASARAAAHILIADTDARTLAVRELQLREAGFRVTLARTAFEAIVKASCRLPDLILLDRSLGDMGAEATGALLTTCPATAHIPILRLSPGRRVPQRVLAAALRRSV
jgi:CheY-like chemotaxis protein